MKSVGVLILKIMLLGLTWFIWLLALNQRLSVTMNWMLLVGSLLLIYPVVMIGRMILDRQPTARRAVWTTTFMHYAVGILFGISIIRAVTTYQDWPGWVLPVPTGIGLCLVILSGAATLLTVFNLALKGLGAPFAIALSQKVAIEWMYAWTRNPMVLSALALLLSLGIWFQSTLFVLWAALLFAPALLFFVKVYEERELALRFGESYLEYKSRTPMLFPRKPRK